MIIALIQLAVVSIWAALLGIHLRRLMRLARVAFVRNNDASYRLLFSRLWFCLGRDEFWMSVQADGLRCTQLTIMLFLSVIGAQP
jgi:hypothetical protein